MHESHNGQPSHRDRQRNVFKRHAHLRWICHTSYKHIRARALRAVHSSAGTHCWHFEIMTGKRGNVCDRPDNSPKCQSSINTHHYSVLCACMHVWSNTEAQRTRNTSIHTPISLPFKSCPYNKGFFYLFQIPLPTGFRRRFPRLVFIFQRMSDDGVWWWRLRCCWWW